MKTSVSLDDLLAFNDELAALVRSGVPLERGLSQLGRELPGKLGHLAKQLAARLESGQSLVQALAANSGQYPPLYFRIVEAGVKSGRLPVALEGLAIAGRNLVELRRLIGLALIYPLTVLLLAYGLGVFFAIKLAPELAKIDFFPAWARSFFNLLALPSGTVHIWGPAIPAAVLIVLACWWMASSRAMVVQPGIAGRLLGWLPGVRRLLHWSQAATFSEVLGLLIEHNVPMDQALTLAADATGDDRLQTSAKKLATRVQGGQPLSLAAASGGGLPPLLIWLLGASTQPAALVPALRNSAESYRQRAAYHAEFLKTYLPLLLSVVIGGTATLAYTLMLFVPWAAMLYEVSRPG